MQVLRGIDGWIILYAEKVSISRHKARTKLSYALQAKLLWRSTLNLSRAADFAGVHVSVVYTAIAGFVELHLRLHYARYALVSSERQTGLLLA